MRILEACEVINNSRNGAIIVSTMGSMLAFDRLEVQEGRINSVPLMGGASCLGLGLALGNPKRSVIVVDGDASVLMQLGSLATISAQKPVRLEHFVVNNGTQFTGTVNLQTLGSGRVDYCQMALAAGYQSAFSISNVQALEDVLSGTSRSEGPILYELCVEPEPPRIGAENPQLEMPDRQFQRMGQEAIALSAWLAEA